MTTTNFFVNFIIFVVGLVVGGGVMFGVYSLPGDDSDNTWNTPGTRAASTLQHIVVVSRHGNRGAAIDYPQDPYPLNDTSFWPYGAKALTPVGRKQEHKLGKKLRSLYDGFLPSIFSSDDIAAHSDFCERNVMSGDLLLAGLYPPRGWQVWDQDLKWQPIALYTDAKDLSQTLAECTRFNEETANATDSFLRDDVNNITYIRDYIYQLSQQNYTAEELALIFEKVISEVVEGYSLAEWIKNIYPEPFTDFYKQQFVASNAGSDVISRLSVGNMLGEILDAMKSKVNGTSDRKITYYSAHDVTIVNLEVALGVPRADMIRLVRPGSAIIVELHKDEEGIYSVQVLFIGGSLSVLEAVNLQLSCGESCVFNTFINDTQRFTNVDYKKEC